MPFLAVFATASQIRYRPDPTGRTSGTHHDFAGAGRQAEPGAAGLIGLQGGGDIQLGDGDLARPGTAAPIIGLDENSAAYDGVLGDFLLVAVGEGQDGGWKLCWALDFFGRSFARTRTGGSPCGWTARLRKLGGLAVKVWRARPRGPDPMGAAQFHHTG